MDAKERTEKIIQHIESIYGKRTGWVIDFVEAQISEAEETSARRAYRLSDETWKKRLEEACAEAVQEASNSYIRQGYKDGIEASSQLVEKARRESFAAAKEKAKGIVLDDTRHGEVLARRIAAMEMGDSQEEKHNSHCGDPCCEGC